MQSALMLTIEVIVSCTPGAMARTILSLQVNKGRMFFWFFEAQKARPEEQPLIIWMTGTDMISGAHWAFSKLS